MEHETDSSSSAQKPSVLLGLLGVLAFVSGAFVFSKVRTPSNNSSRTVQPQDTSDDKTRGSNSPLRSSLVIQPPNNPENSKERRRRKTPWWEKAAVIIALFLLGATWYQGCQTQKAADAANKSADVAFKQLMAFKDSQRAILRLDNSWEEGTKKLTWTVKNVGNSTAIGVVFGGGGGSCHVEREGIRQFRVVPSFLERFSTPIHSDLVKGSPLEPHGEPLTEVHYLEDAGSMQQSSCSYIQVAYQDMFGHEAYLYACMFYHPIFKRPTKCE